MPDPADVEDLLQDVFFELLETYRVMEPVEKVGAWLFRVARNRMIDLFRKKRPEFSMNQNVGGDDDDEPRQLEELLPSKEAGPDAAYARQVLLEELDAALEELPEEQRDAFVAHELEGRSFNELAVEAGLSANTLRLRKHYAVLHLRKRLRAIHGEFVNAEGERT